MVRAVVQQVAHPGGFLDNPVLIKGEGAPIVFLHGPMGQEWPGFLDDLAESYRVIAPAHAGSVDVDDLDRLDGFSDLVLYYDDLFNALGLENFVLIGHSFGGAVAAEYAATFPVRVDQLVLIDAMGLWNDNYPVEDHLLASEAQRAGLFYHDPVGKAAVEHQAMPSDPDAGREAMIAQIQALASTSHFIHPIPERGLTRRLRRITSEALVVWGAQDRLIPPAYADMFVAGLSRARSELVSDAGHLPHVEQRASVSRTVLEFLG